MSPDDILKNTEHRPWAIPKESWAYYQEWNRSIFLHWPVDYHALRKQVPEELDIDTYNGQAWISLVAFTMEKTRPKSLPALSIVSDFDEINIRTYVRFKNKPGVYFLSMEGGKKLSCKVARLMSKLPYRYSKTSRSTNTYSAHNSTYNDRFSLAYKVKKEVVQKTALDKWLTERYALFQEHLETIISYEILHSPWTLQALDIKQVDVDYPRFKKLIGGAVHKAHYSEGVQVLAWKGDKFPRQ